MNRLSPALRNRLLAAVAVGSMALTACVAEAPRRPGVDYGYVAGTYSTPAPAYSDPYAVPYYDDSYYGYNGYNGYNGAYYGGGYYYGPSSTFIYERDHYYPAYGYGHRPRRDDDRHDDRDHHDGDHRGPGRGNHDGGWQPGRPGRDNGHAGGHAGNQPPRHDPPRPGNGGGRPGNGPGRDHRPDPPPRASTPAGRMVQRMQRSDDRKRD